MDQDNTPPTTTSAPPKPTKLTFPEFLEKIEEGRISFECTEQLQVLVREMRHVADNNPTVKPKGTLTLTIDLSGRDAVMEATASLKVKLPKAPKRQTSFFTTRDNCLSAVHPQQQELPLGKDVTSRSLRVDK